MEAPTGILIRDANPTDLSQIISLKQAYEGLQEADGIDYPSYYLTIMKDGLFLVAEKNGTIVGYTATEVQGPVCYIVDSAVSSDQQRMGIFSAIHKEIANRFLQKAPQLFASGIQRIQVVCHVKETNTLMVEILEHHFNWKRGDNYILFSKTYNIDSPWK